MCCICVRWRRFQVECSSAAKLIYTPWHNLSLQRGCFSFWAKLNQFHFPTTQVCMNEMCKNLLGQTNTPHSVMRKILVHVLWTSPICINEITFGFSQSAGYEKQCITCLYLGSQEIRNQCTTFYLHAAHFTNLSFSWFDSKDSCCYKALTWTVL